MMTPQNAEHFAGKMALAERYRDRLPLNESTPIVSLGEGSTPLVRAERLSERLGVEVFLKLESLNPTGSFKDRGMTVAVSKAVEEGAQAVICASTGNTASSAAAYAARAGIPALILQPEGAVASGKLAQTRMYGARVLEVRGTFDEALTAAQELSERGTYVLVNSVNPYRLEGQKTAAFEIVEDLAGAPAVLALPYGGGGNTTAYSRGFLEAGSTIPRILAVEAGDRSSTIASAIRIEHPIHVEEVDEAIRRTEGALLTVSDESILEAWRLLASEEGLFCEPASAASVAGLFATELEPGCRVVCVITGHGLKDPETAVRLSPPPVQVDPHPDAIAAAAR